MNDTSLQLIKDVTTSLLTLGVGVFGLVGGYISTIDPEKIKSIKGRKRLLCSLFMFGLSCIFGLGVFSRIIAVVGAGQKLQLNDTILRTCSGFQILLTIIGAGLFYLYLFPNLRSHTK